MSEIVFERTQKLKKWIRNVTPEICPERAEIVTNSYKATEGFPMQLRRAMAFRDVLTNMSIWIHEGELIVGNQASTPRSSPIFPETVSKWVKQELHTFWERPVDKFFVREETYNTLMHDVFPYWEGKTVEDLALKYMPDDTKEAWLLEHRVFNPILYLRNGVGHMVADYETPIKEGFGGIIKKYKKKIEMIDKMDPKALRKRIFYDSVVIACEAAILFAKRFSKLAKEMAENETDPKRKQELILISQTCNWVPENPARSFHEAVQVFWFVQLMIQLESDGLGVSTDRFDKLVYPFYNKDLNEGKITKEKAQEIIECLWIKFFETMKVYDLQNATYFSGYSLGQIITIGGVDENGRDDTNEITYLCIDAENNLDLTQPNLAVRINKNTPDSFLFRVCSHIAKGTGKPSLFNDEVIIPSMMSAGISLEDSRRYALIGCVEPGSPGRSYGWSNASMFNLAKCFELATNNGRCRLTNKQVGPQTGLLKDFKSSNELFEAYKRQVEFFIEHMIVSINAIDFAHQERLPLPFLSALYEDCLNKEMDVCCGGAKYNFTGPQGVGVADVADSFIALENFIFKGHRISAEEMQKALDRDFEGYEKLRLDLLKEDKYGNDLDYVDDLAVEIGRHYCKYVAKYKNARDGRFQGGLYPVSANVPMGMDVGALPDGRKSKTPIADGVSPAIGADLNGPTAVLKSVSKLDHMAASNGTLLNQKFNPDILKTPEQIEMFMGLIRTYFELGGWHVQFNVVSADTLKKAQKNPEEYKNMLVRVAGYSAFFVDLDSSLQENIIQRTEHMNLLD